MTTATEATGTVLSNISASTKDLPLLGAMTWYCINACEVRHPDLEIAFRDAGLPLGWLPKMITDKNAYLKACRFIEAAAKETVKNVSGVDYMLRKALDDTESCVMVLIKEVRQPGRRDVEHTTVAKLSLNKTNNACSFYETAEANEAIVDLVARHSLHGLRTHFKERLTEREIRTMVLDIFDRHLMSVSVRDKGGVYFIPRGRHHYLEGLNDAVARVSSGAEVSICPIADVAKARGTLYKAMAEEMKKELAFTLRDIEQAKDEDREAGTSMRPKTLAAHIDRLNSLRKKAASYATVMQFTADDLTAEITKVEAKVRELL